MITEVFIWFLSCISGRNDLAETDGTSQLTDVLMRQHLIKSYSLSPHTKNKIFNLLLMLILPFVAVLLPLVVCCFSPGQYPVSVYSSVSSGHCLLFLWVSSLSQASSGSWHVCLVIRPPQQNSKPDPIYPPIHFQGHPDIQLFWEDLKTFPSQSSDSHSGVSWVSFGKGTQVISWTIWHHEPKRSSQPACLFQLPPCTVAHWLQHIVQN